MKCPVCQTTGLAREVSECPNCHADLQAFGYLRVLNKKRKYGLGLLISFFVLAVLFCLAWLFAPLEGKDFKSGENREQLVQEIQGVKAANDQLMYSLLDSEAIIKHQDSVISHLEGELSQMKQSVSADVASSKDLYQVHIVKKGETLFEIAESFYGDGFDYKRIANDNSLSNPDIILTGQRLKIYN